MLRCLGAAKRQSFSLSRISRAKALTFCSRFCRPPLSKAPVRPSPDESAFEHRAHHPEPSLFDQLG